MLSRGRSVSLPHREKKGLDRYPIYDVLYEWDELAEELSRAGFVVGPNTGILRRFAFQQKLNRLRRVGLAPLASAMIRLLDRLPGGSPSTWMILSESESR